MQFVSLLESDIRDRLADQLMDGFMEWSSSQQLLARWW